ncbi:MAG: hypothetical protein RBR15_12990 [Sphaerochaeta sp.]|nr:hypothetical protein [Sphaerochaeta sp.]
MLKEKTIAMISDLLSDSATEISQTCSTRNSVLNVYMGSGLPQLQLDLFKPILLENYAYLCSFISDEELLDLLYREMTEIAASLELDDKEFQQTRVQEYSDAQDATNLYTKYCMFIIRHKANATKSNALEEFDHKKLSSNTLLTLQLKAQRMREVAQAL